MDIIIMIVNSCYGAQCSQNMDTYSHRDSATIHGDITVYVSIYIYTYIYVYVCVYRT